MKQVSSSMLHYVFAIQKLRFSITNHALIKSTSLGCWGTFYVKQDVKTMSRLCQKFHNRSVHSSSNLFTNNKSKPNFLKSKDAIWIDEHGIQLSGLLNLLQTCARNVSLLAGKCCHGLVIQCDIHADILTSNMLINFYSKCGCIISARKVFDRMTIRSTVSYNTLISAYTQHSEYEEALDVFMKMHREGIPLTEFTLSGILCACAAKSAVVESEQLHAVAIKNAFDSNVFVGTALLDVCAKCDMIQEATSIFDNMREKSSVTWSSMVAGFVQNDLYEEALKLFHRAQRIDLERTQFTLSAVLSACAGLAAMVEGAQLHSVLVKSGFSANVFVATSLIDVYSRCGCIEDAVFAFQSVEEKNIVVWNAMIAGFAKHACTTEVFILFEKMKQVGMYPNEITYVSVLSVCSHVGLVEKGEDIFNLLMRDKNVEPNVFHYSCMVDVLGRAGMIQEAWDLMCSMPFQGTASMWGSLLGSCRIYGRIDLAKVAASHLLEIEPSNAGNHVLLANLYAANKRWDEVSMTRKLLKEIGVRKDLGKSWIEANKKVHTFIAGEGSHPRIQEVHAKLEELEKEMKKMDYKAELESDLHNVEDEEKEFLLKHHSEKLALAFGLITLPSGLPIRIHKNLRVCSDCHSTMKFASMITGRKIILRDTNRFHHFMGGSCSCEDFW